MPGSACKYIADHSTYLLHPKTLQYLMGHSDISVTLNVYTHLGLDDTKDEMLRLKEMEDAKKEIERMNGDTSQMQFRVV